MAEEDRDRKRFRSRDEEGHEEDGEKASKSAKAIRLLREVTSLLTESVNDEEAKETREVPKQVGSSTPYYTEQPVKTKLNQIILAETALVYQ